MYDNILEQTLRGGLAKKIGEANTVAVNRLIDADPVWEDVRPAGEVLEGMGDYTVTHSGPPIAYEDMVRLHQRGMVSACLFEGWAKTEAEAVELIHSGKLNIISALDTNTSGSGTGIITKSVAMLVVRDRNSGKMAATFPAEGVVHQGGFCGWGLYSEGIAENLRVIREELMPPIVAALKQMGGIRLKPILARSMQMGDENHTRQTASDLFLEHELVPRLMELELPKEQLLASMKYVVDTPRFFHNLGQGASRAAMLANVGEPYSTMVTAACGNGVTFGIKLAGMGEEWFTAPSPMIVGKYSDPDASAADQIPWCGDSSVVECAGMGGLAGGASPIVCRLRDMKLADAIAQTRQMEKICITANPNYVVPNLDFDCLPVGIDARKVLETGITPILHGGMFNKDGGLLGAGAARVPMECFEKAMTAFLKKYGD